jgi:hypothetical protein
MAKPPTKARQAMVHLQADTEQDLAPAKHAAHSGQNLFPKISKASKRANKRGRFVTEKSLAFEIMIRRHKFVLIIWRIAIRIYHCLSMFHDSVSRLKSITVLLRNWCRNVVQKIEIPSLRFI